MKRLCITNDHGWTPRTLRKQERKIKNTLLRQRVMAVRLVMEGYLGKEVSSMVNVCRQTVSHYVSLFNEGGLELLLHRDFAPGREPFLTEEQQEEIKQLVLTTTPVELGWDVASAWNTKLLQSYVEKHFGVCISREALRKLLHRKGLSWTRPTYTLAKGNPDRQKNFEKQIDFIKKFYPLAAITENEYGDGNVYYIGGGIDDDVLNDLAKEIVQKHHIWHVESDEGVEVYRRVCDDGEYMFILNYTDQEKRFHNLTLKPYDSQIVKI